MCNSPDATFLSQRNGYDFFTCATCKLVAMDPIPSESNLADNFYSAESGYHANVPTDVSAIKKYNKKFVKIINILVGLGAKDKVLDVGCANGEFLFLAKKSGFDTYGVEVNRRTASIAIQNGLKVFCGTLKQAKFEDDCFSVIYLGDVIEHVADPNALLGECKRILKKDGMLVIATPNTDCFWFSATKFFCRWFAFPWSVLVPPYHVYLFSELNMKKLLEKYHFTIRKTTYQACAFRHELASIGLWQEYRMGKSLTKLAQTAVVFLVYTIIYLASFVSSFFLKKDFGIVVFAQSNAI